MSRKATLWTKNIQMDDFDTKNKAIGIDTIHDRVIKSRIGIL
jgi:hypothetical protein